MDQMQRALNQLSCDFESLSQRKRLEREKDFLQLENAFLRLERRNSILVHIVEGNSQTRPSYAATWPTISEM